MTTTYNKYGTTVGTTLGYGTVGATPTYTTLAGLIKSWEKIPALVAEVFDTTRTDQTGTAMQFGISDDNPGTLEFTIGLDDSQVVTVYALRRLLKAYKITLSTGSTIVFNGIMISCVPSLRDKDEVSFAVTIQVSGDVVFAGPSGARRRANELTKLGITPSAVVCKKCKSDDVSAQRKDKGDFICMDCGERWPQEEPAAAAEKPDAEPAAAIPAAPVEKPASPPKEPAPA